MSVRKERAVCLIGAALVLCVFSVRSFVCLLWGKMRGQLAVEML
jgi:hypothetical protein